MKRSAFTLMELLLAVMLMALVLGVIYGVVWAGVKSRQSLSHETDALCRLNTAAAVIQNDLQRISSNSASLRILPIGQTGGTIMEINAIAPSANETPEKIYIFLMPQSADSAARLVRHVITDSDFAEACKTADSTNTVLTSSASATGGDDFEILLSDVNSFTIRCNNGTWTENSYSATTLPAVVEITASLKTSGGKIVTVTRSVSLNVQAGPLGAAMEAGQ